MDRVAVLPFDVSPAAVLVVAVGLVLAVLVLRRLGTWLLGPIFALEISRLARSGRTNLIRILYASALCMALYAKVPATGELKEESAAEFAKQFATLFLIVQSAAVLLIAPLYFGGAISDEKEKHSLDFLLGTRLTAREIVLGKFGARLLNLIGVLLIGLPVLALTLLWGGVDLKLIAVMFESAVVTAFSLGSLSVLLSVMFRRSIHAITCSLAVMLGALVCCSGPLISPIGLQRAIEAPGGSNSTNILGSREPAELLRDFSIVHGSGGLLFLALAVWQLRRRAQPVGPPPTWLNAPVQSPLAYLESDASRDYEITMISCQPIRGDALLWRERNLGYFSDPYFDTFWLYFAGFLFLLALAPWAIGDMSVAGLIVKVFRWSTAAAAAGFCMVLLLRLAGSITREREQGTLESLLAMPMTRTRILYVKWLGTVLRSNRWAGALIAGLVLGTIGGAFHTLEATLLLVSCLSWATFVSALSLLVGVVVRSTARAHVTAIVAVAAILAGIVLTGALGEKRGSYFNLTRAALNPINVWGMAKETKQLDLYSSSSLIVAVPSAAGVYFAAAFIMAAVALWRFRREERYT